MTARAGSAGDAGRRPPAPRTHWSEAVERAQIAVARAVLARDRARETAYQAMIIRQRPDPPQLDEGAVTALRRHLVHRPGGTAHHDPGDHREGRAGGGQEGSE